MARTLLPGDIERLNVHGPYNHAAWRNGEVVVTNEEALTGRGDALAAVMKLEIGRRLDVTGHSLADVGCYDGWLIEQGLAELPFGRRVGYEPREKNIAKGRVVREVIGLPTLAEYVCTDIEQLPDEVHDVVLCCGVLHHLESPGPAIRALRAITGRLLLLETHVLPSGHLTDRLRSDLELKDIVYRYTEGAGVSGQKFETSYYDGSANVTGVVSLSSVETILMHLEAAGFEDLEIIYDPDTAHASGENHRRWSSVLIAATPGAPMVEEDWIADYELGMAGTTLPMSVIEPIWRSAVAGQDLSDVPEGTGPYEQEILRTLRYNLLDKARLEYGKALVDADPSAAIAELRQVTEKLNADWRSVYRAHHAMSRAFRLLGDEAAAQRHAALCRTANPRWPEAGVTA